MPIYEYEPLEPECLICQGRIEIFQKMSDPHLDLCPCCGLGVKRVVSQVSITTTYKTNHEKAGEKGFTTYKRAQKGTYEKIAGDGPSLIQRGEDKLEKEPGPSKVYDLGSDG